MCKRIATLSYSIDHFFYRISRNMLNARAFTSSPKSCKKFSCLAANHNASCQLNVNMSLHNCWALYWEVDRWLIRIMSRNRPAESVRWEYWNSIYRNYAPEPHKAFTLPATLNLLCAPRLFSIFIIDTMQALNTRHRTVLYFSAGVCRYASWHLSTISPVAMVIRWIAELHFY